MTRLKLSLFLRHLLFFTVLFCAMDSRAERWGLSFSLPQFLSLDRNFELSERSQLKMSIGSFPVSKIFFLDTSYSSQEYSDTHNVVYSTNAWIYSTSIAYERRLSERWVFASQLTMLFLAAGVSLHMENIENRARIEFMELEGTLLQPWFGVIFRYEWSRWSAGLSINYLLPARVQLKKSGWLPSFQEVSPSYKDSIDDGGDAAETTLSETLNNLKSSFRLIPGLSVSYRF